MDFRAVLMGLAFALMWSSAFTSARMIVTEAPPLFALAGRFLVSGVLGVAIGAGLGQSLRMTTAQWRATIIFGICQNALYLGANFVAMQTVEAGLAAIVASTMPLLVAAFGWGLGQRISGLGVAGLAAGFLGVALIMGTRVSGGSDLLGLGLCVLGAVSLAVATLAMRGAMATGNVMMVVGVQMLVGSAVLWVPALAFETWDVVWTPRLAIALAYTTLVPGLLATWVWFVLVARIGAVKAATYHFLNPFFGVAIAAVLLGEALSPTDVAGVAIVTLGIFMVQRARAGHP